MADLQPKKINLATINNGKQYEDGDGIQAEAINAPIQASAYAQALATNQPDDSEAYLVGTPSVEIVEKADGTPQFKFKNLKGFTGAKLVSRVLQSIDESGNYIYRDTFDDGTTVDFVSPKGYTPTIQDWLGTEPIGDDLHYIYYDGEKFVSRNVRVQDETTEWYQISLMADKIANGESTPEELGLAVGQEKTVTLTDGRQLTFVILGFKHDTLADGSGKKAGITFGMRDLWYEEYIMQITIVNGNKDYSRGDSQNNTYNSAEIRNTAIPSIFELFPQDLKNSIKEVNKDVYVPNKPQSWTVGFGNTSTWTPTYVLNTYRESLFLFSAKELNLSNPSDYSGAVGRAYDYYKSANSIKEKKLSNGIGTIKGYYVRDSYYFICDTSGDSIYKMVNLGAISQNGTSLTTNDVEKLEQGGYALFTKQGGICFGFCI